MIVLALSRELFNRNIDNKLYILYNLYMINKISYLLKERGKGVKLNGRLLFYHFFSSGAGSASSVYPLVEAQAQRNR